jgi:hypothetical protein
MDTAELGAEGRQATDRHRGHVADNVRCAVTATCASPRTAPAINATMTVLYSISLPVWDVLSQ